MYAIKRKERVVEAARRIGRERADRALLAVEAGEALAARKEARRALSLLAVVGPAMEVGALRRERAALRKVLRGLGGPAVGGRGLRGCVSTLGELRMRAGYWHVEGEGFAVLRPGLLRVVGRARRQVRRVAVGAAVERELVEALRTYGHALRLVERSWPEVLGAERARVEALMAVVAGVPAPASPPRALVREAAAWMAETPGRWCYRVGGYWEAWRGRVA